MTGIAQINSADQMAKPIPLLGIGEPVCVSTDLTVQDTWNTPDACVCSTGMIDDPGFTVLTKGMTRKSRAGLYPVASSRAEGHGVALDADAAHPNLQVFLAR